VEEDSKGAITCENNMWQRIDIYLASIRFRVRIKEKTHKTVTRNSTQTFGLESKKQQGREMMEDR
jgi:hypothetical protein